MNWLVTYTNDLNETRHQITVKGETLTQAYLNFMLINDGIILEIRPL